MHRPLLAVLLLTLALPALADDQCGDPEDPRRLVSHFSQEFITRHTEYNQVEVDYRATVAFLNPQYKGCHNAISNWRLDMQVMVSGEPAQLRGATFDVDGTAYITGECHMRRRWADKVSHRAICKVDHEMLAAIGTGDVVKVTFDMTPEVSGVLSAEAKAPFALITSERGPVSKDEIGCFSDLVLYPLDTLHVCLTPCPL